MIVATTSCYFVVKAGGDAAAAIVTEIDPSVASDISTVILVSADFDSDITALNNMDRSVERLQKHAPTATRNDVFNPLYIPGKMEAVDEMLNLEPRNDNIRFVGMNGNPYILKTVEVVNDDEVFVSAKTEYRPFEMPSYTDIVASRENTKLN